MAKKHRRVALLKVLAARGMIKKEELTKLLDEDPKAVAWVDLQGGDDIRKAISLFQSHVPPEKVWIFIKA